MSGPARKGGANVAGLLVSQYHVGWNEWHHNGRARAHPRGATADHAGDKANTGADNSIGTAEKLDGSPVC